MILQEFTWPVRVYYEDTDAGGIVFYANYLKFFERARTEWLRASGINQQKMKDDTQCMFVVKATAVEYHAPARLDDELKLTVVVERLGRASVHFVQEAWCGDILLVTGKIKVGCVDALSVRPTVIPKEIFSLISPQER
ncbi:MAG: tol-pal system-associated acyl-CoA thioesterase [Pseudomonadota bacterium]